MKAQPLQALLAALETCPNKELAGYWEQHGSGPRPAQALVCRYTLAWQLQARAYGGLSAQTQRQLKDLARGFERDPGFSPPGTATLTKGTEFLRHWKGKAYRVRVTEQGYEYQGEIYASLSKIASVITGASWSGPRFFGLKPDARGK